MIVMGIFESILGEVPIPELYRVQQLFPRPRIDNVEGQFLIKLQASGCLLRIRPGWNVAITVGSRGISDQQLIVRSLVEQLMAHGAHPFIVPAMGSHGGATAEGQEALLSSMGFGEHEMNAPIRSTMDVIEVGVTQDGLPALIDKYAHDADAIVALNRIKPHVSFRGRYESGLMKMIAIGLGKQKGAEACHDAGFASMSDNIAAIAHILLAKCRIAFGIGILENAYHETCGIEVIDSREIPNREPALLEQAKQLLPKFYFSALDVLIVDEIGKDISGTGMDNNVIGRYTTSCVTGGPAISRIAVLGLTKKTGGNANGLGIVDFTTRRVFDSLSFDQTYPNSLTSTATASVKIPMVLASDRLAIQAAIKTCNIPDKTRVRLVRIKNTLQIDQILVSPALLGEVQRSDHMKILEGPSQLQFDGRGNLVR